MYDNRVRLLALCKLKGVNWHLVAREAQRLDGVERLLAGQTFEHSKDSAKAVAIIQTNFAKLDELCDEAMDDIVTARQAGARLLTVLDPDYPDTLRAIHNLPPFIFVRGDIEEVDLRSIAVVGTREASKDGLSRASRMASLLTKSGVTVVSGLAMGIDTAAHEAALDADGRTIAVVGTGITRTFPSENEELAEKIAANGAIVSQFWPRTPPATYTFPRRNITMSGIAQGTLVVEASKTSGAKMQARLALEHGKKVFLLRSLVETQPWAREYVDHRGAMLVEEVSDVLASLMEPRALRRAHDLSTQLELDFG